MVKKKLYYRDQNSFPLIDIRGDSSIKSSDNLNEFGNQRFVCGTQGVQDIDGFHKTLRKNNNNMSYKNSRKDTTNICAKLKTYMYLQRGLREKRLVTVSLKCIF